jgi:hypothetical protein
VADEVNIGPGEEWLVVTCHNPACRKTLLIDRLVTEMVDERGILIPPPGMLQATCPHCKLVSLYHSDEIRVEVDAI